MHHPSHVLECSCLGLPLTDNQCFCGSVLEVSSEWEIPSSPPELKAILGYTPMNRARDYFGEGRG